MDQHDVGHSVVASGRGVLRLSSSISAGGWTPAEKSLNPHHTTTYRGKRLLLKDVKWTTFITF
ncbi:hypothetical protein ACQKMI_06580 [Lysinibacillus sp. NPDC097214]|uniref:hypothetical protein n=1 Tax=Lysinibacillus sp. NPDC097214 TaxID=3390584 RepID=UPI003D077206